VRSRKDGKKLRRELARQGWRVENTRNGHVRAFAPDLKTVVHFGKTESDWRAMANTISKLRQHGFEWKGR
jgi:hypothetical protein